MADQELAVVPVAVLKKIGDFLATLPFNQVAGMIIELERSAVRLPPQEPSRLVPDAAPTPDADK